MSYPHENIVNQAAYENAMTLATNLLGIQSVEDSSQSLRLLICASGILIWPQSDGCMHRVCLGVDINPPTGCIGSWCFHAVDNAMGQCKVHQLLDIFGLGAVTRGNKFGHLSLAL
jgi:hypothetical protein